MLLYSTRKGENRRIFNFAGQLPRGLTIYMRPKAAKYYQLQHSWIREQESDLGAQHLVQARRPAEHRLHCYVDHNSKAPGTLPSPQPALPLPFVRCHVKHSPNEHSEICGLQETQEPILAGLLPQSCLIVVSILLARWCVEQRHSIDRRQPVQHNAAFNNNGLWRHTICTIIA